MTGTNLQSAILDLARLTWYVCHFRPGRVRCKYCRGEGCGRCKDGWTWRTAVEADGKGFFDLVMKHKWKPWLMFIEVKGDGDKMSPEQEKWQEWMEDMETSFPCDECKLRILVDVWKPQDWLDGTIERILKEGP